MISRTKRQPLYQQLADQIDKDISEGKYAPGECLPSIRNLAEMFSVTVPTVQKALRVLINEDKLYARPGVGTFVNQPKTLTNKQIALVLPDVSNPFYAEITKAVAVTCRKLGFNIVLYNTFYNEEEELRCISELQNGQACGVLVAPIPDSRNVEAYQKLIDSDMKTVFIVRSLAGVEAPSVVTADYSGVQTLLEYLIGIGHHKIGYISSYPSNRRQIALQAYLDTLEKHNLERRDEWVQISSLEGIAGGKEGIVKILAQQNKPTAVFACNDLTAIGAINAAHQVGLRVPDDIAIAGFDNIELAEYIEVPLTTMEQPKEGMGSLAAQMLIDLINGETELKKDSLLHPQLIVRQSCGSLLAARRAAK